MNHEFQTSFERETPTFMRERVFPILAVLVAMLATYFIVRTEYNLLAVLTRAFGVLAMVVAIVAPRAGMYMLVFSAGYLDLLKRLMITVGLVGWADVTAVLAVAPILFVGICLGTFGHRAFEHKFIEKEDVPLLALVVGLLLATLVSEFRDSLSIPETIKAAANSAAYIPFLMIAGFVFRNPGEIPNFIRHCTYILLPVPLYAIYQYQFGLAQFEYDYIRTGLTITWSNLMEARPRPFSTLASPHPLSVITAIFCVLSLIPRAKVGGLAGVPWKHVLISVVYMGGCIASVGRSGWLTAFLGIGGVICFHSKVRTLMLYSIALTGFAIIFANAEYIETNIDRYQALLPADSAAKEQMFRLGTIGDRLHGWKNMMGNPGMYTPFGIPESERGSADAAHDQMGEILLNFGVVGLLIAAVLVVTMISWAHRRIWIIQDEDEKRFVICCVSVIYSTILTGSMFGAHTSVFPVNIFFWFIVGCVIHVLRHGGAANRRDSSTAGRLVLKPVVRTQFS